MAQPSHDDRQTSKGCRRPGRAVILLMAILGTYLFRSGTSAPAMPSPPDSDEDDSEVPLAPPEEMNEVSTEEPVPRLEEPDEVLDYPVYNTQGGPPLHEPPGPSDRPDRPRAGGAAMAPHAMATTASASSSTIPLTATTPALYQSPGAHQYTGRSMKQYMINPDPIEKMLYYLNNYNHKRH